MIVGTVPLALGDDGGDDHDLQITPKAISEPRLGCGGGGPAFLSAKAGLACPPPVQHRQFCCYAEELRLPTMRHVDPKARRGRAPARRGYALGQGSENIARSECPRRRS